MADRDPSPDPGSQGHTHPWGRHQWKGCYYGSPTLQKYFVQGLVWSGPERTTLCQGGEPCYTVSFGAQISNPVTFRRKLFPRSAFPILESQISNRLLPGGKSLLSPRTWGFGVSSSWSLGRLVTDLRLTNGPCVIRDGGVPEHYTKPRHRTGQSTTLHRGPDLHPGPPFTDPVSHQRVPTKSGRGTATGVLSLVRKDSTTTIFTRREG